MAFYLLTGATGLLGSYLLRDLLLRGKPVAVLVRPTKAEAASHRIDTALSYWEQLWRRPLGRPVVLAGDISRPALGLSANDRSWTQRNCRCVIHSAASLTFMAKKGEPWRTNVDGVKNLLAFCESAGIRRLAHISSAYVCGLRSGVVREDELDVGQQFGNDYEQSKLQSEKLVRESGFLESFAIFRPSIIVGSLHTGHTSTYHGFYTPLRLMVALLSHMSVDEVLSVDYLSVLGLQGAERKNLVPVDWVSDAILSILDRPHPDNATFALVSSSPVTVARLLRIFEQAIRQFHPSASQSRKAGSSHRPDPGQHLPSPKDNPLLQMLWDQFAIYRSYWRDDPVFDDSNTRAVIPDKPCPLLTDELLLRLCRFAIEAKFAPPGPRHDNATTAPTVTPNP